MQPTSHQKQVKDPQEPQQNHIPPPIPPPPYLLKPVNHISANNDFKKPQPIANAYNSQEYPIPYPNKRPPPPSLLVQSRPTHPLNPQAPSGPVATSTPNATHQQPIPGYYLYSPPPDVLPPDGYLYLSRLGNIGANDASNANMRELPYPNYYTGTTSTMMVNYSHRRSSGNMLGNEAQQLIAGLGSIGGGNTADFFNELNPRKAPNMNFKEKINKWLATIPPQRYSNDIHDQTMNEHAIHMHHPYDVYAEGYPDATYHSTSPSLSDSEIDLTDADDIVEFQARKITRYVTRLYAFEPISTLEEEDVDEAAYGIEEGGYEDESYQVMLHPNYT